MNKSILGLILFIGLLVFLAGCTETMECETTVDCIQLHDDFTGETTAVCEDGKCIVQIKKGCEIGVEEIAAKIEKLNRCEQDEDCAYRGDNCPLYDRIMNKDSDLTALEIEVEQYLEDCGEIVCEQIAHFPLECQERKCVQIIEECYHYGEEIPDEKEFADAKCCDGFTKILKQSPCESGSGTCMENGCPIAEPRIIIGGTCAPCGNGKCEEEFGENKCSCAEDCENAELTIKCCNECLNAAQTSPIGMDTFEMACSDWEYELSEECKEYFKGKEVNSYNCRDQEIARTCSADSDCEWVTGCCGGQHGCVNEQLSYFPPCEIGYTCPAVEIEPAPVTDCYCEEGACAVKTHAILETDKTEFEDGEEIKVTLKNASGESIWYPSIYSGCGGSFFYLQRWEPSKADYTDGYYWRRIDYHALILCFANDYQVKELKPDETAEDTILREWSSDTNSLLDPGKYRLGSVYFTEEPEETTAYYYGKTVTIYSEEFTILPNITIKTDKEEYEKGETVKVELSGDKVFSLRGALPMKKVGEEWEEVLTGCFCIAECSEDKNCSTYSIACEAPEWICSEITEGPLTEWNQKECKIKTIECIDWDGEKGEQRCSFGMDSGIAIADSGTYKFSFKYRLDEKCEEKFFQIESNEFTIKEWGLD